MNNSFEVELRAPINESNIAQVKNVAKYIATSKEIDKYFRVRRDPKLSWVTRIRSKEDKYFLTYKSDKRGEGKWSEVEIEISKHEAENLELFFLENDFVIDLEIEKNRESYTFKNLSINIDDITNLGTYVEAEIITSEVDIDRGRTEIMEFFELIGIEPSTITNSGYVKLLKEQYGKI